ncbi:MAG: PTS transporter subunit EIIA, partial [bacterium]|nr:PTS transporter subunit EIIA [bacterium]
QTMDSHSILTTFVYASVIGVGLLIVSNRFNISAIILLLLAGVIAGPEVLGIVKPAALGEGLKVIVSIAVSLILFEGGMSLNIRDYKKISTEVSRILTWGVFITWGLATIVIKFFFHFDWLFCLLAAGLIIVTGPTVIGPLLQRIKVKKKLHHILHWEGVLIDPIGVFIALLCYEGVVTAAVHEVYLKFFYRFLIGLTFGLAFGYATYQILKRDLIDEKFVNMFIVSSVILNFTIADILVTESGLLSVVVTGLVLGYKKTPRINSIMIYGMELKDYMIGLLFVLLAANLSLAKFTTYGLTLVLAASFVIFLIRPTSIFTSTFRSSLKVNEKVFLSWIAPRGIVAASMASLFTLRLTTAGYEHAEFLEAFTYSIIAGTIVLQGFSAKWIARFLKVLDKKPEGWLIIGAHLPGRAVAKFINKQGKKTVLVDTNWKNIKLAKSEGLTAVYKSAKALDPQSEIELYEVGNVLAVTENEDLNQIVCNKWEKFPEKVNIFYWSSHSSASADTFVGRQIWKGVNIKAAVSGDTIFREISFDSGEKIPDNLRTDNHCLVSASSGIISPGFPETATEPVTMLLATDKEADALNMAIKREWVIFSTDNQIEVIYRKMLETLGMDFPELDIETLLADIVRREEEFTNLVGHGISLPHFCCAETISESLFMLAKISPPIPCGHTREDISLVFLVLSPKDDQAKHLNMLAKIAKFLQ